MSSTGDGRRRVAITGMGMVTPVGLDLASSWDALLAGTSGGGPITRFDTEGFATRIACEVKGFDPGRYVTRKEVRRYDTYLHFGIAAASEAMDSAGLSGPPPGSDPGAFGVIIGSGVGGIATLEANCLTLFRKGPGRVSPFFVPMFIPDMASGLVSIRYGLQGPNYATVSACASSAHAIGDAARHIQRGDADLMLAGGTEAAVTPITIAGFAAMKAMSRRNDDPARASRPFDATRDGFVIGEGAGCFVLEEMEHARARGVEILGEVAGYGASGDAYHITAPPPEAEGARSAMRAAIEDAQLTPDDVGYVNAHGTSTPLNDKSETLAIKEVFGARAYDIVVGSTKSMTGHLLGAAGAVEAVICTMVCRTGRIPPTINFSTKDDDCDLDYAHGGMIERPVSAALSNSFGFGGHNACLVIRKYEE
ncbi:MAG: beta-ketoacyl-ACP synthase II [Gemmatimonadota bacterium]|nr:beta-ketoacyl-ACP synthase II [Gemmatimonadota bacterium]MDE2866243.1 beta-ketoacyl-ACP synthase II [Gemmatimonadota bacterium]MYE17467.1 beta-ketoacyl-ACP synthase II [Gemmatimonadota bacterium]